MEKIEAVRLWIEEHHPACLFIAKGSEKRGYCMIEDPQRTDLAIEIDFYEDQDSFYVYPKRGGLRGVRTLFAVHISDPSYFNKVNEMIKIASTIDANEPPEWNGRPLWTY